MEVSARSFELIQVEFSNGLILSVEFMFSDMAYFIKRTIPWEKVDPGPSVKGDPIRKFAIWVKNSFLTILQFQGVSFKYDNSFFKILSQKYPNKAFLVKILDIFIFSQNVTFRQIRGWLFQIWQYFFRVPVQKCTNKAFLVLNFGIFVFMRNFAIRQIKGCWFQIWQ